MRRTRILAIPAALLVSASLAAAPGAAYDETLNTGTTGEYTINDSDVTPGVLCTYEDAADDAKDEIDRIKVKQLWSHGPFARDSWVGFRFVVKANQPPTGDGIFTRVYRSAIKKKKANQTEVAFFSGAWRTPEGSTSEYRVQVQLFYYRKGSTTNVIGKARGLLEVYRHKLGPGVTYDLGSEGDAGQCRANYHGLGL